MTAKPLTCILPSSSFVTAALCDASLQVEDLARLSFKNKPLYVGVDDSRTTATREGLEQGYVVVPADKRLLLLFTFLKKNLGKKVMVFFSSCNSVKYHR
jgi:ATP-dependent RNA helicase DDX18/HAS1